MLQTARLSDRLQVGKTSLCLQPPIASTTLESRHTKVGRSSDCLFAPALGGSLRRPQLQQQTADAAAPAAGEPQRARGRCATPALPVIRLQRARTHDGRRPVRDGRDLERVLGLRPSSRARMAPRAEQERPGSLPEQWLLARECARKVFFCGESST